MFIDLIAGARPNFIKISPILNAVQKKNSEGAGIRYRLIHTGQHYDTNMSGSFFSQLGIQEPHHNLEAGGGSQAEQTAKIMTGYENLLQQEIPDVCIVVGDVTSTMACAITARKMNVPVAHVEGGIRSGDWTMPEEINRVVTDSITNWFFTTSETANENLRKQGIENDRIFFVGNTMIDTLLSFRPYFKKPDFWDPLNLEEQQYLVLTLHRPSNVDEEQILVNMLEAVLKNSRDMPVIFPVHPRTAAVLNQSGTSHERLHTVDPLPYLEFNYLTERSRAVITDSGGITEETTVMGVPCITLRNSTERPETVTTGTNVLMGTDPGKLKPLMDTLFAGNWKKGDIPEKWDGKAADRIVDHLISIL